MSCGVLRQGRELNTFQVERVERPVEHEGHGAAATPLATGVPDQPESEFRTPADPAEVAQADRGMRKTNALHDHAVVAF